MQTHSLCWNLMLKLLEAKWKHSNLIKLVLMLVGGLPFFFSSPWQIKNCFTRLNGKHCSSHYQVTWHTRSGDACQPERRQRSFWGSLEHNNATSICKDNETNGRGCFQPAAIICGGCLHHNNWCGGVADVEIAGQNLRGSGYPSYYLFPATKPGKQRKYYEWMDMHTDVHTFEKHRVCSLTCSGRRMFSHTAWKRCLH